MLPNVDDAVVSPFPIVQPGYFYIVSVVDLVIDDVLKINDFDGVYRLKFIQIGENPLYLV